MYLLYNIPTIEEAENNEFETYDVEWHPMAHQPECWIKKIQPSYCNTPSELPHVIKQQERYFNISNREDMIMLEREKEAFEQMYQKEFEELSKYL